MGIFALSCPQCGARLDVTRGAELATCGYCNMVSRVGKHTREVPLPKIPPSPEPQAKPESQALPLPREPLPPTVPYPGSGYPHARRSVARGAGASASVTFTVLAMLGVGVWYATNRVQQSIKTNLTIDGLSPPLMADVDGDGTADALARSRYVGDGDALHLAAFSGVDGHLIWQSEILGSYTDTYADRPMLAGDTTSGFIVVVGEHSGALTGWDAQSGKKRWRTELGERTEAGCSVESGSILVGTADKRWHRVKLADGQRTDGVAPASCTPVPSYASFNRVIQGLEVRDRWHRADGLPEKLDGMSIDRFARHLPDGPWLAIGAREPGTAVPMIASVEGGASKWVTVVPERPMAAEARAPEHVLVTRDSVLLTYLTGSDREVRLARFALTTGLRLWDVPVATGGTTVLTGLAGNDQSVWVSFWGRMESFDVATGAHRFTVGQ